MSRPVSVLALVVVLVSACSSSRHGGSSSTASPSASVPADLVPKLLSASDFSAGLVVAPEASADSPLPCDQAGLPSLNQRVPAQERGGVVLTDSALKLATDEDLRRYPDAATASSAASAEAAGFACTKATLTSGTAKIPVTISGPADITTDVKRDPKLKNVDVAGAQAWQLSSDSDTFAIAAVQVGRYLILISFVAPVGADTTKVPTQLSVIQRAAEKVAA